MLSYQLSTSSCEKSHSNLRAKRKKTKCIDDLPIMLVLPSSMVKIQIWAYDMHKSSWIISILPKIEGFTLNLLVPTYKINNCINPKTRAIVFAALKAVIIYLNSGEVESIIPAEEKELIML